MRRLWLIPIAALIMLVGAGAAAGLIADSEAPPQPPMQVQAVEEVVQDTLTVSDPAPSVSSNDGSPLPPMEKPELQYPNLGYALDQAVAEAEDEALDQAVAEAEDEGSSSKGTAADIDPEPVAVSIYLSGHVDDVAAFLEDNGGDPRNVGEDYIEAYVPVTLLSELSGQPGVLRVREIIPLMPLNCGHQERDSLCISMPSKSE